MNKQEVHIYARIDGQKVTREQIREAENARYPVALKILGLETNVADSVFQLGRGGYIGQV